MPISMFQASIPACLQMLSALSGVLDKAAAHAAARKIEPSVLLNTRLYPDMFPLVRQVQLTADFAKGIGARLAGVEPPKYPDTELTRGLPGVAAKLLSPKTLAEIVSLLLHLPNDASVAELVVNTRLESTL